MDHFHKQHQKTFHNNEIISFGKLVYIIKQIYGILNYTISNIKIFYCLTLTKFVAIYVCIFDLNIINYAAVVYILDSNIKI